MQIVNLTVNYDDGGYILLLKNMLALCEIKNQNN